MSLRSYYLIIILAATSTSVTACVTTPEFVDGGTDATDGQTGDLGVLNPRVDGSRDVPSNNRDGSVLDPDGLATGDGDAGAGTERDGSFDDGSALDVAADGNGCAGAGQMNCAGACVDSQTSVTHCGACENTCAVGQSCVSGTCRCVGAQVSCGGACVRALRVTTDAQK